MLNGGFDLNSFFGSGNFLEFNVNGVKGEDFKNGEDSKDYLEAKLEAMSESEEEDETKVDVLKSCKLEPQVTVKTEEDMDSSDNDNNMEGSSGTSKKQSLKKDKSNNCDKCGKKFAQQGNLTLHKRFNSTTNVLSDVKKKNGCDLIKLTFCIVGVQNLQLVYAV